MRTPDLGTYVASVITGACNIKSAADFWSNYASVPHEYPYESGVVRRGMWTVSWYRDLLGEDAAASERSACVTAGANLNSRAAHVPPGSDGLMAVLDWLAPSGAEFRVGTILGFHGRQGRFHIDRSILEALAMTVHDSARRMA
uniref:hypothetical protein n=1 Tax=Streptomyces polyasparticus TaxID=2767826 RepID=UPI001F3179C3|nr:hypothetical protein [Streptomyces polyasparticus]